MKKLSSKQGILLDVGCGENKQKGFVGMDKRKVNGVDIVHDLEKFPWPLKNDSVLQMLASHIVEHIKPWLMIDFMNEAWRVMKPEGQFFIAMPHGASRGFLQDPTHINARNEVTWQYFDPDYPLYSIYKPKPWKVIRNVWSIDGNMEIVLERRSLPKKPSAISKNTPNGNRMNAKVSGKLRSGKSR